MRVSNSLDPDQTPSNPAFDPGLSCLHVRFMLLWSVGLRLMYVRAESLYINIRMSVMWDCRQNSKNKTEICTTINNDEWIILFLK